MQWWTYFRERMARLLSFCLGGLLCLYPLGVYWGITSYGIRSSALIIACLFVARLLFVKPSVIVSRSTHAIRLLAAVGMILTGVSWLTDDPRGFLYYPVMVNFVLLVVFATSLLRPPSTIESFARIWDPDLPDEGVRYTRKVTVIWSLFFLTNGMAALYTVLGASLDLWALYNGFISYLLIGALMGGEYLFRYFWRKRMLQ